MNDQKKIDIVVIKGNKRMDEIFHSFDVFESWKRLCWPMTCELTLSHEIDKVKLVEALGMGIESGGEEFVVASFVPGDGL